MKPAPSLLQLVAGRILIFACVAMVLQVGIVLIEYWTHPELLGRRLIETETETLAASLTASGNRLNFVPSLQIVRRFPSLSSSGEDNELEDDSAEHITAGYFARVRTPEGSVLFSNCHEECAEHFLPLNLNSPDFWQRTIRSGLPLTVTGGQTFIVSGQPVAIEFASIGDPESLVWTALLHELFDHMLVPMSLMLVLVIGATILSIRNALANVSLAAEAADRLDPRKTLEPLSTDGMPRDIARLANATNRAFARSSDLLRSQKLFASAIAHEIRTPVSIVRLELEQIDHDRARKALLDLDSLTHTLDQLTAMARLEAVEEQPFAEAELGIIAGEAVTQIAPFVFSKGKTIAFEDQNAGRAHIIPALVDTLIRNLIENAVKHTPAGTAITVIAGPGSVLTVRDTGTAWDGAARLGTQEPQMTKPGDGLGIGLKIVERIAQIHRAKLAIDHDPQTGSIIRVVFTGLPSGKTPADSGVSSSVDAPCHPPSNHA